MDNAGTVKQKRRDKDFEGYQGREIRLSDDVWEELKRQKKQSGKTWNNFIKDKNGIKSNS